MSDGNQWMMRKGGWKSNFFFKNLENKFTSLINTFEYVILQIKIKIQLKIQVSSKIEVWCQLIQGTLTTLSKV